VPSVILPTDSFTERDCRGFAETFARGWLLCNPADGQPLRAAVDSLTRMLIQRYTEGFAEGVKYGKRNLRRSNTMLIDTQCACGRPLHYNDPNVLRMVERLVATKGPDVHVQVGDRVWLVQRHYIALHGLKAQELPSLGFPEVIS
jgi:hypothetical protein